VVCGVVWCGVEVKDSGAVAQGRME
jgi:hypothetical protein